MTDVTLRLVPDDPTPRVVPVPALRDESSYQVAFDPGRGQLALWHVTDEGTALLAGIVEGVQGQVEHLFRHGTGIDEGSAGVFMAIDDSDEDSPGYAILADTDEDLFIVYGPDSEEALAACRGVADAVTFLLNGTTD